MKTYLHNEVIIIDGGGGVVLVIVMSLIEPLPFSAQQDIYHNIDVMLCICDIITRVVVASFTLLASIYVAQAH